MVLVKVRWSLLYTSSTLSTQRTLPALSVLKTLSNRVATTVSGSGNTLVYAFPHVLNLLVRYQ